VMGNLPVKFVLKSFVRYDSIGSYLLHNMAQIFFPVFY